MTAIRSLTRFAGCAAVLVSCAGAAQDQADVTVAPGGNDATGTGRPEAPFATLTRAQAAVRELRTRDPNRATPLRVRLRAGTYFLAQPLEFAAADSGTATAPVVWSAAPGEAAVISGGVRLTGWQAKDGRWQLSIPEVARGEWSFCQLFVNGERRHRPRLPREGYFFIEKELPPTKEGQAFDRFGFREGDIRADWQNRQDVEVLPFHFWGMSRLRIGEVDPQARVLTFTGPTCGKDWWAGLQKGHRYLVENVREALTEPGQWYLDRPSGLLTYIPLPGEDPATSEVIAPRLEALVTLQGDAAVGLWVDHLRFENLTFAHTNWVLPPQGYSYPQAEAAVRGAIRAVGARRIVFERCTIAHLGTYGIDLGAGCSECRIEDCELYDLGAGGIRIGEGWGAAPESRPAEATVVRNNRVAGGGRLHPAGIGVWIGLSPRNVVEHNDIADFYYTGISVGWTWGYGPTPCSQNTIADNHVWQIGQGVLSDMGGIYTLGLSPGTVIRHNSFHDIDAFDYGGWGIYFDEGTSDMVAEDNLVYRTKTGGFHQHYGKGNTVRNNIFAFARIGQIQRSRDENHLGFTFEQNLVYWSEGPLLHGNWTSPTGYVLNRNLYWNAAGEPIAFAGQTVEAWQAKGYDRESVFADPLFENAEANDFRLKPGSPALTLGFKPFPLTGFGRQTPTSPAAAKPMPRAFPPPPPPPPPSPIDEDFEILAPGSKVTGAQTYEDEKVTEATARVSAEQAASGKHSLKFNDRPGQQYPWNPHVFWDPNFTQGTLAGRFDLRLEGGTQFFHEWRDASSPYRVGPSLRVRPDGTLVVAGDRVLATLPLQQWVRFDIVWAMTGPAAGTWALTVTLPGAAPQRVADLPCDPHCKSLRWYGFCAEGNDTGGFYVDSIHLGPQAP